MTLTDDLPDPDDPRPEDLHQWLARDFTVAEARDWIGAGFRLAAAERWRDAGVYSPADARAWRSAGTTPATTPHALRAGMTPQQAVRWHELGYTLDEAIERHLAGERPHPRRRPWWLHRHERPTPDALRDDQADTMRSLLHARIPVALARAYLDTGWTGPDTVSWASTGLDPTQAAVYRALGLGPAEAARLAADGQDALDLLRTWWDATIPLAEVPAWIAAGFTPTEARDARHDDTTVEQAAILGALRIGEQHAPPNE